MPDRGWRRDIQGLRAVSVALVVAYHAFHWAVPGGYVGVDVFFVISGYLITGLLAKELTDSDSLSLARFYARRARRILPAATVVIVVTVVAAAIIFDGLRARSTATDGLYAAFFVLNYRLAAEGTNYMSSSLPSSPILHYWSLSVEEQFYALWPALLWATSFVWWRRRRRSDLTARRSTAPVSVALGLVAVVSLAISIMQSGPSPSWDYFSLLTRAWELAAGGLLALHPTVFRRLGDGLAEVLTWGGLAAVGVSAWLFSDATPFPGWATLLPVGGAVLLIGCGSVGEQTRGASWLLGKRPMQVVGERSYSIYLWHYPVLVLGAAAIGGYDSGIERTGLVALSVLLAATCYQLIERPALRAR
ncbi:MAG TPA: acyltransferase, partial [Acidimicrobiales bacterium]|nr:acyltransferase [Acidimicrobiales bacterium]